MCGGMLIFASYTSRAYFYTFRSVSLFRYVKIIINKKKGMSTLLAWRVAYVQFLIVCAKTSPRDHCIPVTCCLP